MLSRLIKAGLVLCLMISSFAAEAHAQETISPAKRELIKELLLVTGASKTAESIVNSMLNQSEKDISTLLSQTIEKDLALTPSERAIFQRQYDESRARASKRFRELFMERVNFSQLMDEISYSIYDKYFTENELRDLVTFYKSPTGRKTIEVLPQLFSESMAKTSEVLLPKVQQIMTQIMAEEKSRLETLPRPARATPAPTKKRRSRS